ncbi:MAG: hypothetical protein PHP26_02205 [Syntrophomonas sp.]|uniref:hypothetical protein n=1 Tax=Syntrophomonas sp. TaxID=2053627 RepID=UPI0026033449|nr:hypothetical protein [Syntrophomonas sp.]MDD2511412.1 hypothetical protein [Syntrophomonas sp.]MDD3878787.1 hypothetical protein [Syntrophomonas sp.]MDD4627536.1 hypothetical protein [Syntrophomonas sp.]
MLAIFGSAGAGHGIWANPLVVLAIVAASIYIFLKFCSWAKNQQLSAGAKKMVFIITGLGLVVFNVLYVRGNTMVHESGDWSGATTALLASLVWVFIFAYALMADTKAE